MSPKMSILKCTQFEMEEKGCKEILYMAGQEENDKYNE
jgi:hypothetical protein